MLTLQTLLAPFRAKPAAGTYAQANPPPPRGTIYGEQFFQNLVPTNHMLADEGSYFVATNPTIGTPIAAGQQTVSTLTLAGWTIQNTDSAGGKRIYLDGLSSTITTVAGSATQYRYSIEIDSASRLPSAGNALASNSGRGLNVNMDDSTASIAIVNNFTGGALMTVPTTGPAGRMVATGCIGGLAVVGDEIEIVFGRQVDGAFAGGTVASRKVSVAPPIIIGPQQWAVIHLWQPAGAGGISLEYLLKWWER